MTIRNDVTVDWTVSPRLITVLSPSTEITVQDLVDTLRFLEDSSPNMTYEYLIDAAGKEPLGGSVFVGVTATLNNAVLAFEDRPGPNWVLCKITGGNLVAVDANGDTIDPRYPTAYVTVDRASSSSATLLEQSALQFASFQNAIWVDAVNGSPGTEYPLGTREYPVSTLSDAKTIGVSRGLYTIGLLSDYNFNNDNMNNFHFIGESRIRTTITVDAASQVEGATFENLSISGVLNGGNRIQDCYVGNITNFHGFIGNSGLAGTITLGTSGTGTIESCYSYDNDNLPTIDLGSQVQDLAMHNFSGTVTYRNIRNDTQICNIGINAGIITLEPSVSAGNIIIAGNGLLFDNSTGTAIVNDDGLLNSTNISEAVWDESIGNHLLSGTTGLSIGLQQYNDAVTISTVGLAGTAFPIGTERVPVNNLADALTIATNIGVEKLTFDSNFTLEPGDNVSGYTITSDVHSTITVSSGVITQYTNFSLVSLRGTLGGYTILDDYSVHSDGINEYYGIAERLIINGPIGISTNSANNAIFIDCYTGNVTGPPEIDLGGDGAKLSFRGLTGAMLLTNKTGTTQNAFIDLYSARLGFDSTITAGSFVVRGSGYIYQDDSTNATINTIGLMSQNTVSQAVWDEPIGDHITPNTTGHQLYHQAYDFQVHISETNGTSGTAFPIGTEEYPVDNLSDALTIAKAHNFKTIHVIDDLTIDGENVSDYTFIADRSLGNTVTINSMTNSGACYFTDLTVSGSLTGPVRFTTSVLGSLTGFDGGAKNCLLTGDISIVGSGANYFTDCDTYFTNPAPSASPTLTISGNFLNLIRCRGGVSRHWIFWYGFFSDRPLTW